MTTRPLTAMLAVLMAVLFLAVFVRAEEVEGGEKEVKKSSPEKEDGAVAEKASPEKDKASPEKASPEKEKASPEKEKASPEKEKTDDDAKPTAAAKPAEDPNKKKPRSLLQACKKEAKRICGDGLAVAKCLTEKANQIEDETCKLWVDARSTCLSDAEGSNKCGKKEMPRACLRKLSASDVSEKCAQSDFFKAVQMYTRWRRRHEATKAAAPVTEAAKTD